MNNQNNDDPLHRLLQQWREIEPSNQFEAGVRRRIRLVPPERTPAFADWLRRWLPQPAFAWTAAAIAGVVIGATSGLVSVPPAAPPAEVRFLAPETLAGSYLTLARR